MSEKQNAIITVGLLGLILLAFALADIVQGDRLFSETENRILTARPDYTAEKLFSGEYGKEYEDYITDQFPGRDKWIQVKTQCDLLLGHQEMNGVYLGQDGYLLEKHASDAYSRQQEVKRAVSLNRLVEEWGAKVMLVPTADNILTDKLPAYADYYDETRLLNAVRMQVGKHHYIDVYSILKEHSREEIYYRTDHHWTSLGAYYGYLAWTDAAGRLVYPYKPEGMITVSEDFQGTLHSRILLNGSVDRIQYFPETLKRPVKVFYDRIGGAGGVERDSLYEESYLDTKNQYGFYLDDNHAFVEIQTDYHNAKTLFVIKDSYANSMIPLLTPHYETIYVLDLRYFNGRLFSLLEQYEPENGMDVLVLYNCIHFMEDFQYYE